MGKLFKENKVYIVLGMHKSGTSFLAKALKEQGVNMGHELLGADKVNTEGHFEDVRFLELNEKILREAGGSWDNPPSPKTIHAAAENYKDELERLIKGDNGKLWGWKEPRTNLTIEEYLPYFDTEDDVYLIAVFRKPKKVAMSLQNRAKKYGSAFPYEKGIALVTSYNERLLAAIKAFISSE